MQFVRRKRSITAVLLAFVAALIAAPLTMADAATSAPQLGLTLPYKNVIVATGHYFSPNATVLITVTSGAVSRRVTAKVATNGQFSARVPSTTNYLGLVVISAKQGTVSISKRINVVDSLAVKPAVKAVAKPPIPANGKQVCDKFGSTTVTNNAYLVQNDNWGDDSEQCISAFATGFAIVSESHDRTDHPGAYPSLMSGCWMQTCTTGTHLPAVVSSLPPIKTSIQTTTTATGKYNVAYDIWADPTARKDGQNTGAELMIWLKEQGGIKPIGSKTATVTIGGTTWNVWTGKNGDTPVISWVRAQYVDSAFNLPVNDFVKDAVTRGIVQPSWYLTNIQAGFEPWQGGKGLAVNSFSVS